MFKSSTRVDCLFMMLSKRIIWLLLLLIVFGSSPAHAFFSIQDHVGNTAALTDESETVIDEFHYSPYGTVTYQKNSYETPFRFGGFFGIQTDSNGLVHMRARYYNPLIRRFINSDPARDQWNWFVYAGGNPISYVDPGGLKAASFTGNSGSYSGVGDLGFTRNVTVNTFISAPSVSIPFVPFAGSFSGDNRVAGQQGTYRTSQTITVNSSSNNFITGPVRNSVGETHQISASGNIIRSARASGETLSLVIDSTKSSSLPTLEPVFKVSLHSFNLNY